MDENLQVIHNTILPLPHYINDSANASQVETVRSIRSATHSSLVAIVAGGLGGLSLWDEATQRLESTPVGAHEGLISRIAPVGSTGLLTVGIFRSSDPPKNRFFQWQWTKDNTVRRVYDSDELSPFSFPLTVMDSTHTGMIAYGEQHSRTVKIFQAAAEEEMPSPPLSHRLSFDVASLSKMVPPFAGEANNTFWALTSAGAYIARASLMGLVDVEASSKLAWTPPFRTTSSPSGQCLAGVRDEAVLSFCAADSFFESHQPVNSIEWTQKAAWTDLRGTVEYLEWSPQGEWIFGSNQQGDAVLWGVATETAFQHQLLQQESPVVGVGWLDTHVVATIQRDGTLTLWSALDGTVLQQQALRQTYLSASFVDTPTGAVAMMLLADGRSVQRVFLDRSAL